MPQEKKSICFIVNPTSGKGRSKNIEHLIWSEIDQKIFNLTIKLTEFPGHAAKLSEEAVKDQQDIIVAVGGDGTINEVAGQMIGSSAILGIIPRGSGNGLARHLNIPFAPAKALQLINTVHSCKIDTGTINGKSFISLAGVGFDAKVAKQFAGNKTRGFITYFNIIAKNFLSYKPKKYSLEFKNGETLDTRALFITVANSSQFGYNTVIAPNAKLSDGKLDVVIVAKPNIFELPIIANLLLLKRIDQSKNVQIIPTSEVTIRRNKNRWINLDGEAVRLKKTIRIAVNPLSLNVIIPKDGQKK